MIRSCIAASGEMNILHISTYDLESGAGRAAYRLHKGLRQLGQNSQMLARYKSSADDSVFGITAASPGEKCAECFFLDTVIQGHYIDAHRTELSNTIFSLSYPGYELSDLPIVQGADIINLHWIDSYQSPVTLHTLFDLKKPVVWTLHDQWPFTGGCHYTAGCNRYRDDCIGCPQLADDPFNVPAALLQDKQKSFQDADLSIVAPSRWLAARARESKLFRDRRTEIIPNSLEADIFRPMPKSKAKATLGLGADVITLLFGAGDGKEKRKGFHILLEAITYCLTNTRFRQLVASDRVKILCFGRPHEDLASAGIPVIALGYLGSDEAVQLAYAASDMFILPSLEDNLPNTMLEAMGCGTPVIGSDVGGIPDMVKDGITGYLVPSGDVRRWGETLLTLTSETKQLEAMGQNCRKAIEEGYTLTTQARRYVALYKELCQSKRLSGGAPPEPPISSIQSSNTAPLQAPGELTAQLETAVGPHLQSIFPEVLLKSLKECALSLEKKLRESETDRASRFKQITELSGKLKEAEEDRLSRFEQIHELTERLREAETDRLSRFEQIHELTERLKEAETDRSSRFEQINKLSEMLKEAEVDRLARFEQIIELTRLAGELNEHIHMLNNRLDIIQRNRIYALLKKIKLVP